MVGGGGRGGPGGRVPSARGGGFAPRRCRPGCRVWCCWCWRWRRSCVLIGGLRGARGRAECAARLVADASRRRSRRRARVDHCWRVAVGPAARRGAAAAARASPIWPALRGAAGRQSRAAGIPRAGHHRARPRCASGSRVRARRRMRRRRDLVTPGDDAGDRRRRAEVIDLRGRGPRPSRGCRGRSADRARWRREPHAIVFAPEAYWRGETHRLCDRPSGASRACWTSSWTWASSRLLLVSAAPESPGPHALTRPARSTAVAAWASTSQSSEAAAVRDATRIDCRGRAAARVHHPAGSQSDRAVRLRRRLRRSLEPAAAARTS